MSSAERALNQYTDAYQKLYSRTPKDIRTIDAEWVLVNGARMRANELEYLTSQLLQEYRQTASAEKRNVLQRLMGWFKQN
jgi:hypothetical protein